MKLDEKERAEYDILIENNFLLKQEIFKLKREIQDKFELMKTYELKRDRILQDIIPSDLFVIYQQRLAI